VGDIPHDLANEESVRSAMGAFGGVDAVQLRLKGAGQLSWSFVIMGDPEGALKAVAAGVVACGEHKLKLEPVALKRELHAERQSGGNPDGTLGDVWRKTVQRTSHGKQLDLLWTKLQEKTQVRFAHFELTLTAVFVVSVLTFGEK